MDCLLLEDRRKIDRDVTNTGCVRKSSNHIWVTDSNFEVTRELAKSRRSFLMKTRCQHINEPLTRYVELRVAHAPGIPGTFSMPPRISDSDMHHGTCMTHLPWCMSVSLTCSFLWNRWRRKCPRHSRRMCIPQFYVRGKPNDNNLVISRKHIHICGQHWVCWSCNKNV